MIISRLSDQLGNQMFAYASGKSIAEDLGYVFRFYNKSKDIPYINSSDNIYGHKVNTIFSLVKSEEIDFLPDNFNQFREVTTGKCKTAFNDSTYNINDNTILEGHYMCPKYFYHKIDRVRKWFTPASGIISNVDEELERIREKHKGHLLVSVHFRNGKDYKGNGFLLSSSYWKRAAKKLIKNSASKIVFLVFYDEKTRIVNKFISKYKCEVIHKSLVFDMFAIAACDQHIICNSSYSIISALLDKKNGLVIRPSHYPVPDGYLPEDTFLESWEIVYGKKNIKDNVNRKISNLCKNLKRKIKKIKTYELG